MFTFHQRNNPDLFVSYSPVSDYKEIANTSRVCSYITLRSQDNFANIQLFSYYIRLDYQHSNIKYVIAGRGKSTYLAWSQQCAIHYITKDFGDTYYYHISLDGKQLIHYGGTLLTSYIYYLSFTRKQRCNYKPYDRFIIGVYRKHRIPLDTIELTMHVYMLIKQHNISRAWS